MLNILRNRFEQGYRTNAYPKTPIQLPESYRGRPKVNPETSAGLAERCASACPQGAIDPQVKRIDLGKCVFCGHCERISEGRMVSFSQNFELAVADKVHLISDGRFPDLKDHAKKHFKKLFGRSLQLRQVSAAGCNACEADLNVLESTLWPPRAMPTGSL
jgi:formate hydrogenlyase subunit 6/NADH:ubiquinone oxidoreductase subunit I